MKYTNQLTTVLLVLCLYTISSCGGGTTSKSNSTSVKQELSDEQKKERTELLKEMTSVRDLFDEQFEALEESARSQDDAKQKVEAMVELSKEHLALEKDIYAASNENWAKVKTKAQKALSRIEAKLSNLLESR